MTNSHNINEEIHKWIENNKKTGIELLRELVQADSTQGNELKAQKIVESFLKSLHFDVDYFEQSGDKLLQHPYFVSPRTEFKGSPNVIGLKKGTGGGRSLILNGHIDVVPAGDRNQWQHDPFSGEIIDGKLYGRGSSDMKGGSVSLLLALAALAHLDIKLQGDLIFQSVIEEESGGSGTLASILRGYKADAAIIPEPTNMKIFPKQQGSMWFRIHVKGLAAHGGTRYEGVSAIDKATIVIEHIKKLEQTRNETITDPLYVNIPIPIPINIGKIEGGNWPSTVPDNVTLEGRMGVHPEETLAKAKQEMEAWLGSLKEVDAWFEQQPVTIEWFGAQWVPGEIELDHPLMTSLIDNFNKTLQYPPTIEAAPWGTDGGLLSKIGLIPTIVFGPGATEKAHYPNEYIELEKMFQAAEIIALTIIDWCGISK